MWLDTSIPTESISHFPKEKIRKEDIFKTNITILTISKPLTFLIDIYY